MPTHVIDADCAAVLGSFRLRLQLRCPPTFAALFGPSGCGKTSTLKLLAGLIKPEQGHIRLHGELVFDADRRLHVPPHRRGAGLVFQDSRLFPHLSVRQNLGFGLARTPREAQKFSFDDIVDFLQIGHLLARRPTSLSGGEAQRVAIGRALLASPQMLLMDEPLAALDQPAKIGLLAELQRIHRELGLPILYVSHDLGTVVNMARQVFLMRDGEVVDEGPPWQVLAQPLSGVLPARDPVRNLFDAKVEGHDEAAGLTQVALAAGVRVALPRLPEPPGARVRLELPASEIIVATAKPVGLSARNILPGRVVEIHHLGPRVILTVDAGVVFLVEIVEGTLAGLDLHTGSAVYLVIKATALQRVG